MLYWMGNKELEVRFSSAPIEHAFVRYGKQSGRCTVLCDQIKGRDELYQAFIDYMDQVLASDSEAQFMFYASTHALGVLAIRPDLRSHIVCQNSDTLISWLTNKSMTRFWASNYVSIPPSTMISGGEIRLQFAESAFPGCERFVIQENVSSAGRGTYLLDTKSERHVASALSKDNVYLLSPYIVNGRSYSSNMLIDEEKTVVLPSVRQNILVINGKLRFCGSDFSSCLAQHLRDEIARYSRRMGDALRLSGYRGYLGIDYLEIDGTLMFLEVNPRFQGSSFLIDRALSERALPALATLHLQCFSSRIPKDITREIEAMDIGVGYMNTELASKDIVLSGKKKVLFETSEPGQRFIFYRC